ncbi:MAG: endonuclease/exonuclease/phosphatase family protein [Chthoniobacteraceae bacterium]
MFRRFLPVLFALSLLARAAEPGEIIFCSYNVENYTAGHPASDKSPYALRAKSEKSIAALVAIVKEIGPAILGVCEMGSVEKLAEFQKRLADAGVDLPHSEFVAALDEDRHLALLSRFPIVARNSASDAGFMLNGRPERVRRGFLDVTIEVNASYRLRCVGVHLKSKLPIPEGEALVRRLEAGKLREHLDGIFSTDADVNLICYGDFNDTKDQPMFHEVTGAKGSPRFMTDLWCRDPLGDRWTYYWRTADQYSRIDYLFVSPSLFPEIDRTKSAVYRSEHWSAASDHRPISAAIRPVNVTRR